MIISIDNNLISTETITHITKHKHGFDFENKEMREYYFFDIFLFGGNSIRIFTYHEVNSQSEREFADGYTEALINVICKHISNKRIITLR